MDAFVIEARAAADQREAAMRWSRTLFPENAWLIDNAHIEAVVLATLDATSAERAGHDAHLLVAASGAVVVLSPDDPVEAAVRAAGPRLGRCDYCQAVQQRIAGLLPVVAPPQVIVLALCAQCLCLLDSNYASIRVVLPTATPDSPEGIDR